MGRQELTRRKLAQELGVSDMWVSRRLSTRGGTELTLEDVQLIADVLKIPVPRLLGEWLPRVDSNHQPTGYAMRPAPASGTYATAA